VNEVQLLEAQLACERQHLRALGTSSAAITAPRGLEDIFIGYITSYASYLMFITNKERARAQAHLERFGSGQPLGPADHAALEHLRGALASADTIDASLRAAMDARSGATEARERAVAIKHDATVLEALIEARVALEALAAPRYTVDDWRHTAQVDADSILEERRLREQVLQYRDRLS
jgi:hypothetical protein